MSLRVFAARYPSKCARCSVRIYVGDPIAMLPGSGAVHEQCVPETFGTEKSSTEEGKSSTARARA